MSNLSDGERRCIQSDKVCRSLRNKTTFTQLTMLGVTYEYDKKLAFCSIPRAGSTSWKQIIRFLNHDWLQPVDSPFDIPRIDVNLAALKNTTTYSLDNAVDRTMASRRYTFMFTRNPYTRLWSAYLDKIYLPDAWTTAAKNIVRIRTVQTMKGTEQCPIDVSFYEFVDFITSHSNYNRNWLPVHRICGPCHFRFDFIGKQETFEDDRNFILNKFHIEHVLAKRSSDFSARRITDATNLITNSFRLNTRSRGCLPEIKLAERLWTVLKLNGYLNHQSNFSSISFVNEEAFISHVANLIKSDNMTATDSKRQKDEACSRAYQTLPENLRNRVRSYYQHDFLIFGYDDSPKNLGF